MGLFDRFRRKALPTCDWCSTEFEGTGIESGGLIYCGQDCLDAAHAPPVEPEKRDVFKRKALTMEDVAQMLERARDEIRLLVRDIEASVQAEAAGVPGAGAEAALQSRELEFWQLLDEVRGILVDHGRDPSAYDPLRSGATLNSIEIRSRQEAGLGVGLRGPGVRVTRTATADFADGNIRRMDEAVRALEDAPPAEPT